MLKKKLESNMARKNLLLIEDNPGDARLLEELLKDSNRAEEFHTIWMNTLSKGINELQRINPDIILLDLSLAESSGLETFDSVNKNAQNIPIIILSGLNDEMISIEAVKRGAQDYLVKGQIDSNLLVRAMIYAIERKKAEEENKYLQSKLIQSEKMAGIGTLAAGVAHEFNNFLNMISLSAQIAIKNNKPDEVISAMNDVLNTIKKAKNIVDDLLSFSRQNIVEKTFCNLTDILETVLLLIKQPFEKQNIKIIRDYKKVPELEINKAEIQLVFLNLIRNAIDEMPNGGTLNIKVRKVEESIWIEFLDTGKGIPEENFDKIFDPFYTTKGVLGGGDMKISSGLGLYVALGTIHKYNGTIDVESELNKGTKFIVKLPFTAK